MNILMYITNHGYGHASRNVPIIKELSKNGFNIIVKSDKVRNEFLARNLIGIKSIKYYDDVTEVGLLLVPGHMYPDKEAMLDAIKKDRNTWPSVIKSEVDFIIENQVDFVLSDTVAIGTRAASLAGVRNILIGNFDWALIYKNYYEYPVWKHYLESYKMADFAVWYDLHSPELHSHNKRYKCVSLISREVDYDEVEKILARYDRPIVFVSLGGSATLEREFDVSNLEYDFLVTPGIKMIGDNVHFLPRDMINTPDYIAASEYVIAKGGWSTVAEILLLRKKAILLMRSDNPEDMRTKELLTKRKHCIAIAGEEQLDFEELLRELSELKPDSYDIYNNDCHKLCDIIKDMMF